MIVRILGEGQYRLTDDHVDELNTMDAKVEAAVEAGDEASFAEALATLLASVRSDGTPVGDDELINSDNILPPSDASLAEVSEMLGDEGLIPG